MKKVEFNEIPVRTDYVFDNAPNELGGLWAEYCDTENELAEILAKMPEKTIVSNNSVCWFLRVNDGYRELSLFAYRPDYQNLKQSDIDDMNDNGDMFSRFNIGLDWVDIEEHDLNGMIDMTQSMINTIKDADEKKLKNSKPHP